MRLLADKIIQPYMTEKSSKQQEKKNEFAVIVDKSMTKTDIKHAVETVFGVKALEVRTVVFRRKARKTKTGFLPAKTFKKALVRLPEGKRLELK